MPLVMAINAQSFLKFMVGMYRKVKTSEFVICDFLILIQSGREMHRKTENLILLTFQYYVLPTLGSAVTIEGLV